MTQRTRGATEGNRIRVLQGNRVTEGKSHDLRGLASTRDRFHVPEGNVGRIVVLPTYQLATTDGNTTWTTLSGNGTFTFASDINFTYSIPTEIFNGDAVNLTANLTNYNNTVSDGTCSFFNGTDTLAADNYIFTTDAEVNITCTSSELGLTLSENVSVSVVDAEVVNYENYKTFDTFPLRYRNVNFTASTSTCANLTLSGYGVGSFISGDYCEWNVSYSSGVNELVNITSTGFAANFTDLINVTSGLVYFDVADVFGVFYLANYASNTLFSVINPSKIIASTPGFNLTTTIFDKTDPTYINTNEFSNTQQYYHKGNIFSTKEITEFVN